MYAVSAKYKKTIAEDVREYKIRITSGSHTFTDENIIRGTFYITNQCSDETSLQIGQVFIGEMGVTLHNTNIGRYAWKGMELRPEFGLVLEDGTVEYVPLGYFIVNKAEVIADGVKITAYDRMSKFDRECTFTLQQTTLYAIINTACNVCGVSLGTTANEFSSLANTGETINVYSENDISTWRDVIYWAAQMCAAFATMGRDGKLYIRSYNQNVVNTLTSTDRYVGSSFSGYITRYTGISVVDARSQYTKYYGMPVDDGLTYNLGSNPFMQFDLDVDRERACRAILTKMQQIYYEPFSVISKCDPSYDLGDVLKFTDGLADDDALCCITKFTLNFHGTSEISGAGEDPAYVTGNSKTDKNLAGLMSRVEYLENIQRETDRYYYDYMNRSAINVEDGASRVKFAEINYEAAYGGRIEFRAEIKITVSTTETFANGIYTENDAIIRVYYRDINTWKTDYYPLDTYTDGTYLLSLRYMFIAPVYQSYNRLFEAFIEVVGGSLAIAANDARSYITTSGNPVEENHLTDIEVLVPPNKIDYIVGETLDYTGLIVVANYEDGSQVDITSFCTYNPANYVTTTKEGDITVDVTYTDADQSVYHTDFELGVWAVYVESIDVTRMPSKTMYRYGESTNYSGIIITATYSDGTEKDVTSLCTYSPSNGSKVPNSSDFTVDVSYTEHNVTVTTDFDLEVDLLDSIEVTKVPTRYDYRVTESSSENLDYSGVEITAFYVSGNSFVVTDECTFTPVDGSQVSSSDEGIIDVGVQYEADDETFDADFELEVMVDENESGDDEEPWDGDEETEGQYAVLVNGVRFNSQMRNLLNQYTILSITRTDRPEPKTKKLSIKKKPDKTTYLLNETVDYTGIIVYASFNNIEAFDVTDQCTFNPTNGSTLSSAGEITVTASYKYNGVTNKTTFKIIVKAAQGV